MVILPAKVKNSVCKAHKHYLLKWFILPAKAKSIACKSDKTEPSKLRRAPLSYMQEVIPSVVAKAVSTEIAI